MLNHTHALRKANSWCQKQVTNSFQNKEYMQPMRRHIMHLSAPTIFLLSWDGCWKTFSFSPLLPMCSHQVPNELPLSFPSFQHLPQNIPSSTSLPSHTFGKCCPPFTHTRVACAIGPRVNPLQNKETQYMTLFCKVYPIFEELNMKGSHSWIEW